MFSSLLLLYPSFFTLGPSDPHLKPSPEGGMSVLKFLSPALVFALLVLSIKTGLKHWTHWNSSTSLNSRYTTSTSLQLDSRYLVLPTHTRFTKGNEGLDRLPYTSLLTLQAH
jgi:hypothetical protein